MSDYLITGRKGTGKSLYAIGVIRSALENKKRVATNLNVRLEHICKPGNRQTIIRIPDRPTAEDMEALGRGQDGVVEADNGVIIIDECSTFLGARTWGDKERQPLLDWLVHSRKYGWDVYYIAQGVEQLDKMIRTTLVEYHISVKRTDKWPIPFVTSILKTLTGFELHLPAMSVGTVRYGVHADALVLWRDWYKSKALYPAYDTQQVFLDRNHHDAMGMHSMLSAWHYFGRYQPQSKSLSQHLQAIKTFLLYGPPKPSPTSIKHPLSLLLSRLPPDLALYHWHRLDRLGAFDVHDH